MTFPACVSGLFSAFLLGAVRLLPQGSRKRRAAFLLAAVLLFRLLIIGSFALPQFITAM